MRLINTDNLYTTKYFQIMETLKKGQEVTVTTKRGVIDGVISGIDTNVCTFDIEYSVDYMKDGEVWTMICVPASAIKLR